MTTPAQIHKSSYKNLIVYQKAKLLSIKLFKYFAENKLPFSQQFLVNQLLRSATSIGANIVEGYGRNTKTSVIQFYKISRGSCFETEYWLEILLEIRPNNKLKELIEINSEICKILTVLINKSRN